MFPAHQPLAFSGSRGPPPRPKLARTSLLVRPRRLRRERSAGARERRWRRRRGDRHERVARRDLQRTGGLWRGRARRPLRGRWPGADRRARRRGHAPRLRRLDALWGHARICLDTDAGRRRNHARRSRLADTHVHRALAANVAGLRARRHRRSRADGGEQRDDHRRSRGPRRGRRAQPGRASEAP